MVRLPCGLGAKLVLGGAMKRPTAGNIYWAIDYKELVEIVAIEREARRNTDDHSTCLIRRANGEETSNYPAYLLMRSEPYPDGEKAVRHRDYVRRYREKNREALNAKSREYNAAHRDERQAKARQSWIDKRDEKLSYHAAWRASNPDKVKANKARHRRANAEAIKARARELHAQNPERRRGQSREQYSSRREAILARKRFKRYGITPAQFDAMLVDQDRACVVCKVPFSGQPHVDHDHATGQVRGLLCFGCNAAIGQAKDSSEILRALADYLDDAADASDREGTA